MRLSVILVQYRTPALVSAALDALSPVLSGPGVECVVIDNDEQGSRQDPVEVEHASSVRWIQAGSNLGYAGGINLGIEETSGDHVIVMNPDVLVQDGCVERLCGELDSGAAIAGPRFFWDQELRLLLPPAEERTRRAELLAALAGRGSGAARRARRRWRRHARGCWRARGSVDSWDLPGALIAFRRSAFDQIGPFDSGYRLYFEETDWLARARRAKVPARHVSEAVAVHLYDQSARVESASQQWFSESASRYRRRHYGPLFEHLLARVEATPVVASPRACAATAPIMVPSTEGDTLWLELSPRSIGFPAVGERVAAGSQWSQPPSLARWHAGTVLWGRWVTEGGREIGEPFALSVDHEPVP